MSNYPSDLQEKFMLRLPDGMRDLIAAAAKTANRSMNAEIIARLQETFSNDFAAKNGDAIVRAVAAELRPELINMVEAALAKKNNPKKVM